MWLAYLNTQLFLFSTAIKLIGFWKRFVHKIKLAIKIIYHD